MVQQTSERVERLVARTSTVSDTYESECALLNSELNDITSQLSTGAELTGIILALELAIERRNALDNDPFFILTIHTDSKYAIGCLRDWIDKWLNNGWCNTRGRHNLKSTRGLINSALKDSRL